MSFRVKKRRYNSNNHAARFFFSFLGIFSYLRGLKHLPMYFQKLLKAIFWKFFYLNTLIVLKYLFSKLENFFTYVTAPRWRLLSKSSKMKQNFTYMFIKILEMFLPTRLLEPTRLLIPEKSSYLHCY